MQTLGIGVDIIKNSRIKKNRGIFYLRAAGAPVRLLPSARGLKRPKMALESTKIEKYGSGHSIEMCVIRGYL